MVFLLLKNARKLRRMNLTVWNMTPQLNYYAFFVQMQPLKFGGA